MQHQRFHDFTFTSANISVAFYSTNIPYVILMLLCPGNNKGGTDMATNKHLTLNERIIIETMLNEKSSFREIAKALEKNPSSISREIRHHLLFQRIGGHYLNYNACVNRISCSKSNICSTCHSSR